MASVSKQKRKAEREAKKAGKASGGSTGASTPNLSSKNASSEDLTESMAKATINGKNQKPDMGSASNGFDRSATGVLVSMPESRDVKIDSFQLSFHGRLLVENGSIELNYGQRYGLLGANGSGKTTFLEALANREVPIPQHIDLYLLKEEAPPSNMTASEFILAEARKKVEELEKEIEELSVSDNPGDEMVLQQKYDQLEELEPEGMQARVSNILVGLGFDHEMMQRPTKDMSGGWRMRVTLGEALFIKPTLLLLDEPTNHLDLEAVVWLEAYLAKYPHTLVLTSHSQDFMNNVCTYIMDLTMDKKLVYYTGNYDSYVRTKTEQEINQSKAYYKQQDEIAHIKRFIASAGTYSNLVRQAKSKQKIIDKMEADGLITLPGKSRDISFKFENLPKLPPPVIGFTDVAFSYFGTKETYLYDGVNFGIDMDSRVAIVGKNGTGKSTLVNLISGVLMPTRGDVARHSALRLSKYNQHSNDQLPFDKTPLEYFQSRFSERYPNKDLQFWRSSLGRFGISGGHQTSQIYKLSDGLKSRVVFAQLALEEPHILLLDEPTNHLDIASIDALAKAINEFSGGVVLVSHDFRLISQVAGEIWEVKDKQVEKIDMTIEEYKKMLKANSAESVEKAGSKARTM